MQACIATKSLLFTQWWESHGCNSDQCKVPLSAGSCYVGESSNGEVERVEEGAISSGG